MPARRRSSTIARLTTRFPFIQLGGAARSCNTRLLTDTAETFRSVRQSLPPGTNTAVLRAISAAGAAARRGNCAVMHKHAQQARSLVERRLDMLLGARGRRRRRRR